MADQVPSIQSGYCCGPGRALLKTGLFRSLRSRRWDKESAARAGGGEEGRPGEQTDRAREQVSAGGGGSVATRSVDVELHIRHLERRHGRRSLCGGGGREATQTGIEAR